MDDPHCGFSLALHLGHDFFGLHQMPCMSRSHKSSAFRGQSSVPVSVQMLGLFSALSLASWDLALHARSAARGWSLELLARDVWGASPAAPPPVQGSAHRPVPSASLSTVPVPSVQRGHHALPGSASRENAGQAQGSAAHCPASITVASFFQFYSVSSLVMVGAASSKPKCL